MVVVVLVEEGDVFTLLPTGAVEELVTTDEDELVVEAMDELDVTVTNEL